MAETIDQQIEKLGINPGHFITFYDSLKSNKVLPPEDIVPEDQYKLVVGYLTDKDVLNEDGNVQEEGFKLFDNRKRLENDLLEDLENEFDSFDPDSLDDEDILFDFSISSGGINPCRTYKSKYSNGGINPCRY